MSLIFQPVAESLECLFERLGLTIDQIEMALHKPDDIDPEVREEMVRLFSKWCLEPEEIPIVTELCYKNLFW